MSALPGGPQHGGPQAAPGARREVRLCGGDLRAQAGEDVRLPGAEGEDSQDCGRRLPRRGERRGV